MRSIVHPYSNPIDRIFVLCPYLRYQWQYLHKSLIHLYYPIFSNCKIPSQTPLLRTTTTHTYHSHSVLVPRFMSPPHDSKEPRQLLWFDRIAIERVTRTAGLAPLLLKETATTSPTMEDENAAPQFPVKPSKETVGEFKVPPSTHAGYAVTWYGLSGAGIFMTRKLMTRGRG